MGAIRVIIMYKDSVDSISVDGEEMQDLSSIQNKPIEAWFEPSSGRDGWEGLIREVQKQAGDEDAEFSFEFYGPHESEIIFETCIRQRGFGTNALSEKEIIEDNMEEALKAEHRGIHSKAFKHYKNAAAYGVPEAQFKAAEYYYKRFCGEEIGVDINPQDAIGEAIAFYEKAAKQNYLQAQWRLYELFSKGEGVNQDWGEAIRWLQSAVVCGDIDAGRKLAWHYQSGTGVDIDQKKAFSMYSALAKVGDVKAQHELGNCYRHGLGTQIDNLLAFEWYTRAAEQNYAEAQYELGNCYNYGYGTPQNRQVAFGQYKISAEQGCPKAQHELGKCYSNGWGVPKDELTAFKWYQAAAKQNFAAAQYDLGMCYYGGKGTEQDRVEAAKWYMKAANQNFAEAQYRLGGCYHNGDGVEQSDEAAVKWYRKAAEQGLAEAQCCLADHYHFGTGVDQDYDAATEWERKAAEQGYAEAQYRVGKHYYHGEISPDREDLKIAVEWYNKAAEQGHIDAQYCLGIAYIDGGGVQQDFDRGVMWITKAAENGNIYAQDWLGASNFYGTPHISQGITPIHHSLVEEFGDTRNLPSALYWYGKVANNSIYGWGDLIFHACIQIVAIYEEELEIEPEDKKNPVANMKAVKENDRKYKDCLKTDSGAELVKYCRIGAEKGKALMNIWPTEEQKANYKNIKRKLKRLEKLIK